MALVVYQLPFYAGNIIDKMIENDWFVHSFYTRKCERYI